MLRGNAVVANSTSKTVNFICPSESTVERRIRAIQEVEGSDRELESGFVTIMHAMEGTDERLLRFKGPGYSVQGCLLMSDGAMLAQGAHWSKRSWPAFASRGQAASF